MTRDDIIKIANKAGLCHFYDSEGQCTGITDARLVDEDKARWDDRLVEMLAPFAALVAAVERDKWEAKFKQLEALMQVREQQPNKPCCLAEREACAEVCEAEGQRIEQWRIERGVMPVAYGVKANVKAPHRFLRMGGLCWMVLLNPGGGGEKVQVRGMSRGGRKVSTWIDARDLKNFRSGWFKEEPAQIAPMPFTSRNEAQAWADAMNERFGSQPVREHAKKFGRD